MTHDEGKHGGDGGDDWQEDRRGLLSDNDYGQGDIADEAKFENGDAGGGVQPPPAAARSVRFNETPQVARMPNGSANNIAGITNQAGNVLGLMPHPERCCEAILGGTDGKLIFQSIVDSCSAG